MTNDGMPDNVCAVLLMAWRYDVLDVCDFYDLARRFGDDWTALAREVANRARADQELELHKVAQIRRLALDVQADHPV